MLALNLVCMVENCHRWHDFVIVPELVIVFVCKCDVLRALSSGPTLIIALQNTEGISRNQFGSPVQLFRRAQG